MGLSPRLRGNPKAIVDRNDPQEANLFRQRYHFGHGMCQILKQAIPIMATQAKKRLVTTDDDVDDGLRVWLLEVRELRHAVRHSGRQ